MNAVMTKDPTVPMPEGAPHGRASPWGSITHPNSHGVKLILLTSRGSDYEHPPSMVGPSHLPP